MKRMGAVLLAALACVLLLSACSGQDSKAVWTLESGEEILSSGAFSETLEELDMDTAWMLYKLGESGLDRPALTDGLCRRSAGATCEELSVLIFDGPESAQTALASLQSYLEGQISANQDYRPGEIPKLEGAWLEQRGNTLLMAVANDLEAAKAAVGEGG